MDEGMTASIIKEVKVEVEKKFLTLILALTRFMVKLLRAYGGCLGAGRR